jgi:O-antigen polysaccharide polymerase Wzy-like protein
MAATSLAARIYANAALLAAVALACAVVLLGIVGSNPVVPPILTMLCVGAAFIGLEQRRSPYAPIGLGTLFCAAVLIYTIYPLLIYIGLGGYYTPLNDQRLFVDQPDPAAMARIAWYYVVYFVAFCAGYQLLAANARPQEKLTLVDLDRPTIWALLATFVVLRLSVLLAEVLFAAQSTDYLESYLKYKHLPLIAQQVLGHMEGMTSVLALGVVAVLCREWRRWRFVVLGWLAFEIVVLLVGLGARTQFVLLCLAVLVSYHYLYRPLSLATMMAAGSAVVVLFLAFGFLRAYVGNGLTGVGTELLAGSSEFESLFGNAYDVERLTTMGEIDKSSLAAAVYLGDIINLVPQQLMPFEKLDLQRWYVATFHSDYAERGGGLAFGAIAEGLIGLGVVDLIWRGLLVGLVFCWFDRTCRSGRVGFWRFVIQVWLISSCYLTFRSGMLALLPVFVYRFLPAMLAVAALAYLLRVAATNTQKAA